VEDESWFQSLVRTGVPVQVGAVPASRGHWVSARCDPRPRATQAWIALGISPPRGHGDDDAWEKLSSQLGAVDCAKEYWSDIDGERKKMRALGFEPHKGYFDELLRSL
jgi:hypothetical protein